MNHHSLFLVSDRTGITVENLVRTLLTQYQDLDMARVILPFLDTSEKIGGAVRRIDRAAEQDGTPPLVFSSLVDAGLREQLKRCNGRVIDIFETFLSAMSESLETIPAPKIGRRHGMGDVRTYDRRVEAVNFALNFDDGSRLRGLDVAELILVGVSRSGKTPTCLYLAMQYGIFTANYPLTDDDFGSRRLPDALQPYRDRLFGLTITAERLHQIREERRPGSDYASLPQCRREIAGAEEIFADEKIPCVDSTRYSIEELAIEIMQQVGVERVL